MSCNPSPDWFRTLAESLDDVVFRYRLSPTQGVDYLSAQVFQLLGRRPEDFYGDADLPRRIVHPDDLPLLERLLRAEPDMLTGPNVLRFHHADGRIVSVE